MRSIGLRTTLTSVLIFLPVFMSAINPEKTYRYTPEDYNLEATIISVDTDDGAAINTWYIPSFTKKAKASVLVAYSDAGNMAYWLSLAYYLHSLNYDIWLFDYRGFGESSDFEAMREMLFYNEYVTDLKSVLKTVESKSRKPVFLVGYSMGTIIINEYLHKSADNRVKAVVYDGFIGNPYSFVSQQEKNGKHIILPPDYKYQGVYAAVPALYIRGLQDNVCSEAEIPSSNARCVTFDCGHIMALSKFTNEYISELESFFCEQLKIQRK